VKGSLDKSGLLKLFTRASLSQSHTNNEFFKLVEALPQIYPFTQYKNMRHLPLSVAVTVSLHYLPKCICSTVACRVPIQWFSINPDCIPPKKEHIRPI